MVACAISSRFEAFRGPEALSRDVHSLMIMKTAPRWRGVAPTPSPRPRRARGRSEGRRGGACTRSSSLLFLPRVAGCAARAARFSASSRLRRSSSAFCCSSWAAFPAPFLCERPFCASALAPAPSFFLTASGNVSRSHRSSSAPSTYSGSSSDSAQAGFPLMSAGGAAPSGRPSARAASAFSPGTFGKVLRLGGLDLRNALGNGPCSGTS